MCKELSIVLWAPVSDIFGTQSTLLLALYSCGEQAAAGIHAYLKPPVKKVCAWYTIPVCTLSPQDDEVSSSEIRGLDNIFRVFGRATCGVTFRESLHKLARCLGTTLFMMRSTTETRI